MGNQQTQATQPGTGFFGNLTNNLGSLMTSAAPLVSALSTRGAKEPVANTDKVKGGKQFGTGTGMSTQMKLVIGGSAFLLMRKRGR